MNEVKHSKIIKISKFRFYEELNDFLSSDKYKRIFNYEFYGTPSIKDTIEAIGVPHSEIDLILVDGISVGFDYKMKGNEVISVYPVFESFDISSEVHLRDKPLRDPKFIVDVNIGKLARKLRLLGFDTLYSNKYLDKDIIEISLKDRRAILTRDKGLLKHNKVTHGYWIRNENSSEQIKEVVKRFQLENSFLPFTRCTICNQLLINVDKKNIISLLPERTGNNYDDFMICHFCKKTYWKGAHYRKICEWISELNKK